MASTPTPRRSQAQRSRDTQRKLVAAVVTCLDERGYAQTTLATVQDVAGVSRGAVLHHFPNKQQLIAGTAQVLLASALSHAQTRAFRSDNAEDLVVETWRTVVNTPEGRAFVEILGACRTDEDLRGAVQEVVTEWEPKLPSTVFHASDDAAATWGVCRAFLRGMLLELSPDPAHNERCVRLFGRLLAQTLSP
ncbi:MAG: TetR/AcrR family transcriptional regulator [Myxococcales bacterium]|nr:TetR/AcrR family transcriptional regulator [Myxococcales bacterium]